VVERPGRAAPPRSFRQEIPVVVLAIEEPGHPPAEDDPDSCRVLLVEGEARVGQRFAGGGQADNVGPREAPPEAPRRDGGHCLDLSRQFRPETGRVEKRDRPDPAAAGDQAAPGRPQVASERGDGPEPGDDDAPPVHALMVHAAGTVLSCGIMPGQWPTGSIGTLTS
jgi:hypothetical protein